MMKPFLPLPHGRLQLNAGLGRGPGLADDVWQHGQARTGTGANLTAAPGSLRIEVDHFARPANAVRGAPQAPGRAPLLLDNAPATQQMLAQLRTSAYQRGPWRTALTQLSWMPHTELASRANISTFSRSMRGAADWAIFSVGLALGILALPTLVPLFRCARGYSAVRDLRRGLDDVSLATDLAQRINQQAHLTPAFAEDVVRVYRGQACQNKLIAITHRSRWSAFADAELLEVIDRKLPGFFVKVKASDAASNRRAQQVKLASTASAVLLSESDRCAHPSERSRRNTLLSDSLFMLAAAV